MIFRGGHSPLHPAFRGAAAPRAPPLLTPVQNYILSKQSDRDLVRHALLTHLLARGVQKTHVSTSYAIAINPVAPPYVRMQNQSGCVVFLNNKNLCKIFKKAKNVTCKSVDTILLLK